MKKCNRQLRQMPLHHVSDITLILHCGPVKISNTYFKTNGMEIQLHASCHELAHEDIGHQKPVDQRLH